MLSEVNVFTVWFAAKIMASDNSIYTTSATDYDGDTTETIPSADSNYFSAQSDTIRYVNNPNAGIDDQKAPYTQTYIDEDREDEMDQKDPRPSSPSKHHRKRSGLLYYIFALFVLCARIVIIVIINIISCM